MTQIGQENDPRKFRRAKSTDYYAGKAAFEKKPVTKWPVCENCGINITGKSYMGSKSGKYLCQWCWSEGTG